MSKKLDRRSRLGLIIGLYLVSLLVHGIYAFHHVSFGQDAARDALIMRSYQRDGVWLVGYGPKASVGDFYLPPLYYQVHNLISRLANNYELAMLWVTILVESATPVVFFMLMGMLVALPVALVSSLLFVLSPLVLNFSTFMWNPNMIPFFSTVALFAWMKYLIEKRGMYIPIAVLAVTVTVHLHYQGAVLIPFLLMVMTWSLWRDRVNWRWWLIGIGLSVLTFLPYLQIETQRGWGNSLQVVRYFTGEHARTYERVSKPGYVLSFLPGFTERVLIGGNTKTLWLGRLIFWVGLLLLSWYAYRQREQYGWTWLYFMSIFGMLRVYKGDKLDYYMSVLYIMPMVFYGLLARNVIHEGALLSKNKSQSWFIHRYWFTLYRILVLGLTIFIFYRAGKHVQGIPVSNGLHDLRVAVAWIAEQAEAKPVRFYFHHQDYTNDIIYGTYMVGLERDPGSEIWVDVCQPKRPCAWNGKLVCEHDWLYTKAAVIKSEAGYQFLASRTIGPYQLVVGRLGGF